MCFTPQRRALFRHLNFQKWSGPRVFCTFWPHFFDISTSKSAPNLVCFVHFDLARCFAPQRRALVGHRNFEKCSEPGVRCTFWLGNVLRAITACNCSSLIWPDGSALAALASLLFDPLEPQITGKTQWIAIFLPFRAPASSSHFFSLWSSLCFSCPLWLFPSAFPTVHVVGSFTSKLPSTMWSATDIPPLSIDLSLMEVGPLIYPWDERFAWSH